ncbi:GPP34 family phosphoprotein [Quadrisphaera sp. DSM 44207]|uniref:GOLPH3/VPS74 family protein n=1 Tax=Quadrisphaera sp. DSM 44207 TaxID=1881057 RepID=UPI000889F95E|nr:GPP34 family phosphoprotein [Quadrisphaera sp. DSM 44207]SDQ38180.1 Golgi phosphoprotein 3 (GPP34) [Quadrisphaera sp. DSM 44207]
MLVVEELALLLVDAGSGAPVTTAATTGPLLAAGVLRELELAGRVRVEPARARGGSRVALLDPAPAGSAVLDRALAAVAERAPCPASRLLTPLGPLARGLAQRVLADLVAAGALAEERSRLLGVLPVVRHRVLEPAVLDAVRARMAAALTRPPGPDARAAALVALLAAAGALVRVHDPGALGTTRRELLAAGRAAIAADPVAAALADVVRGAGATAGSGSGGGG